MSIQATSKFASPIVQGRSVKLLATNIGTVFTNTIKRNVNDLQSLRFNALMISGAILVGSRIIVANTTAAKTRGTPEGPYRYQEAVKTTFREILAWVLTYVVLLYSQRVVADLFRNMLWAKGGIPWKPSHLNGVFQKWFQVPDAIKKIVAEQNETKLKGPIRNVYNHLKDFVSGTQKNETKIAFQSLMDEMKREKIEIDFVNRKSQFEFVKPFIDKICKYAVRKNPERMPISEKISTLFTWAPPIIGSIPSILLSGYFSESITQKYAEKAAAFISKKRIERSKEKEQTMLDKRGVVNFSHTTEQQVARLIPSQFTQPQQAFNPYWAPVQYIP